jgi:hypothetical protein
LPDQPMGRAVEGALEHDMAVGVELGPFPDGERIGRGGQRLEDGPLDLLEALQRALFDGPMNPLARDLPAPSAAPGCWPRYGPGSCARPGSCA